MSLETLPLFVRDWFVALFPDVLQWLVHHLITIAVILTVFGLFFGTAIDPRDREPLKPERRARDAFWRVGLDEQNSFLDTVELAEDYDGGDEDYCEAGESMSR